MIRSAAIVVAAFAALIQPLLAGQADISQPLAQQVDRIFSDYARADSPGCSLGVIRDGNFIYRKSYGSASLELGVPLTPQSVFYVGSISKQFTAASVVLAAEQGYLSLDDDIRKYIPELPDYGHTITLRRMLNQTSGFRDFFDLLYFSGFDWAQFNSPPEILKLIVRQKGLNNAPGDKWIYSNTNYFLLGVALERATKKTLAQFAAENIFQPLGMTHTRFYDDASDVVPGRVAAYDAGKDGHFVVAWSTSYAVVGGGGLMTTVDDLLLWDNNFYSNHLGKGTLLKELQTPGILNDGKQTVYGMGLFLGNYRGLPTVEHDGALFGYRADLLRFPGQKFTVACLCNFANAFPEDRARKVADLFLKDDFQADASAAQPAEKQFPDLSAFVGQYLDPGSHTIDSFTAADGNLMAWGLVLRRKNASQFLDPSGDLISFENSNGSMHVTIEVKGESYFSGPKISEIHLGEPELRAFAGQYRSPELDGAIGFSLDQGALMLNSGTNPPVKLVPVARDEFAAAGTVSVVFHRDQQGAVSGLTIFAPAARGIAFNRVNP
jgi:CubicO group peptidase (beta-lactamase class C family)